MPLTKMSQDMICAKCNKSGTEIISRCGHILHDHCYENLNFYKNCQKCGTKLAKYLSIEKFMAKIKSSNLDYDTAAELIVCLDNISTYRRYDGGSPATVSFTNLHHPPKKRFFYFLIRSLFAFIFNNFR